MVALQQARAHEESDISRLMARLYEVISFEEGGEPDWEGLTDLFSAHAKITRVTPEGTDYLDRDGFLAMTRNMLEIGAYTSFYEFEVGRHVQRFGDTAQVWSLYETRRNKRAQRALTRGVNSIHLVREPDAWRVLSLLWDEAHADAGLDPKTVFRKGDLDA